MKIFHRKLLLYTYIVYIIINIHNLIEVCFSKKLNDNVSTLVTHPIRTLYTPNLILIAAYWPRGDSAASSLFGGMPGGYGLGAHHLPSAYAILGRGGSAPGFGGHTPASAPPPPPYSHSSLGTLSVAASQAASLGNFIVILHIIEISMLV